MSVMNLVAPTGSRSSFVAIRFGPNGLCSCVLSPLPLTQSTLHPPPHHQSLKSSLGETLIYVVYHRFALSRRIGGSGVTGQRNGGVRQTANASEHRNVALRLESPPQPASG